MRKKHEELAQAPVTTWERVRRTWFESAGKVEVERNRFWLLNMMLGLAIAALAFTLYHMMPLKTVVPYIVRVDNVTGQVAVSPLDLKHYQVREREIRRFMAWWIN